MTKQGNGRTVPLFLFGKVYVYGSACGGNGKFLTSVT